MRSELFGTNLESSGTGRFALQNPRMLRVALDGEVMGRQGAMVAYQGQVDFAYQGAGGMGKFLKKTFTGEGMPLMKVSGRGDVFFADDAMEIHLVNLENDALTVNGSNVLAFDSTLAWDIKRVEGASMMAGGVFNTTFTGTGTVAHHLARQSCRPRRRRADVRRHPGSDRVVFVAEHGRTTHRWRRCTHRPWLGRGLPARVQRTGVRRRPGQRGSGGGSSQPLMVGYDGDRSSECSTESRAERNGEVWGS